MISKNLLLFGRRWVEAGQMMDTLETKTRAGEMVQAVPVAIIWTNPICVALEDRGKLLLPGQISYVPILAARICFPSLLWHLVRGQWWQPWSWSFLSFSSCWVSCGQHQQHSQQCLGVIDPREVPQGSPGNVPRQRWDVPLAVISWWWGIWSLQHMNHFPVWEFLCPLSAAPQHPNELPLSLEKGVVHRAAGEKWEFFPEGR